VTEGAPEPFEKLRSIDLTGLLRVRVEGDAGDENVLGLEAQRDAIQVKKTSREEAASDEEHASKSDLRDHERAAQTPARGGLGLCPSAGTKGSFHGSSGSVERGRSAERERRRRRREEGETEGRSVSPRLEKAGEPVTE
jgi:hypothetical protein